MDVRIAQERAFVLHSAVTEEMVKEKAWSQKLSVFGTLNSLMFRPKDDEVRVTRQELRYEPFWHVAARSELEYDLRETFTIQVRNPAMLSITLDHLAQPLPVVDGQAQVSGVSRCREVTTREQLLDGVTGEEQPGFAPYLRAPMTELTSLDGIAPPPAVVVPPEIRSSYVVRQQLAALVRAVQADRVHTELIEVESVALFFRPLYLVEFLWVPRQKVQVMALDAVTGEMKSTSRRFLAEVARRIDRDLLFDIGADAADLLLPGGAIVMKVGRMVAKRTRSGREEG